MGIFFSLKQKFGRHFLKKEKGAERKKKGSNFNTARNVAIVFDYANKGSYDRMLAYRDELRGEHGLREIEVLTYVDLDKKKLPDHLTNENNVIVIDRDDLNWKMQPKEHLEKFSKKNFDLLLDFSEPDSIALGFILARSMAGMIASRKNTENSRFADLLLDIPESEGKERYIEELNFYLTNLNLS